MTRTKNIQQKLRNSLHMRTLVKSYEQRFASRPATAPPRREPSRQGAKHWVGGRRQKHKSR